MYNNYHQQFEGSGEMHPSAGMGYPQNVSTSTQLDSRIFNRIIIMAFIEPKFRTDLFQSGIWVSNSFSYMESVDGIR